LLAEWASKLQQRLSNKNEVGSSLLGFGRYNQKGGDMTKESSGYYNKQ
jgi:hypothetical protein